MNKARLIYIAVWLAGYFTAIISIEVNTWLASGIALIAGFVIMRHPSLN